MNFVDTESTIVLSPRRVLKVLRLICVWVVIAVLWLCSPFVFLSWSWAHELYFVLLIFITIFMGLSSIFEVINTLPGASFLKLTNNGFTRRTLFKTLPERQWGNFAEFNAVRMFQGTPLSWLPGASLIKRVMWNYSSSYRTRIKAKFTSEAKKLRWERAVTKLKVRTGFEGVLPDNYGMGASKLAALMNEFKQAHSIPEELEKLE